MLRRKIKLTTSSGFHYRIAFHGQHPESRPSSTLRSLFRVYPHSPVRSRFPSTSPNGRADSRWRSSIKDVIRRLRLPARFLDIIDIGSRLAPFLRSLQERRANDGLVAHDMRVVIWVRGAVRAVEAINGVVSDRC